MGFLSLKCPFFKYCCRFLFLVDPIVVLEHIFICIEEILLMYIRDSDFITIHTNIETKI